MFITSPEAFAEWFNRKYLGTYRKISAEDIKIMASCGLICRYHGYNTSQDGETVRGILQYEQVQEERSEKLEERDGRDEMKGVNGIRKCKRCGRTLIVPYFDIKCASPERESCQHRAFRN